MGGGGDTPATLIVCPTLCRRHQNVAQFCRNIQPYFSKCLGIENVCLGFKRIHRNVNKKYFFKSKKIIIWGKHYFITKLKTEIDVIPRSCFKLCMCVCVVCVWVGGGGGGYASVAVKVPYPSISILPCTLVETVLKKNNYFVTSFFSDNKIMGLTFFARFVSNIFNSNV